MSRNCRPSLKSAQSTHSSLRHVAFCTSCSLQHFNSTRLAVPARRTLISKDEILWAQQPFTCILVVEVNPAVGVHPVVIGICNLVSALQSWNSGHHITRMSLSCFTAADIQRLHMVQRATPQCLPAVLGQVLATERKEKLTTQSTNGCEKVLSAT